jgi:CubicO group peptidase (beta-lactamase class C family)
MQTQYDLLDDYIEGQKRRLNIPGLALAVVEGDRIEHYRGFGVARPGGETPALQTPFYIGSLTKSFTALAVMQLVEAGIVGLDVPVQRYLPWFRVADPEVSARITIRHLLNQTSGLPTLAGMAIPSGIDEHTPPVERLKAILYTLRQTNPPGTTCSYCNLNYDLLGLVIEDASGESYAGYVQAHIFDPLEMRHSYCARAAAQQDGLAVGYRHWFMQPFPARHFPSEPGALPSGYIISCAEDMAHYLIAHLNGGSYAGGQVLSSAGMDELHRGAIDYRPMGIDSGRYAMGWFDEQIGQMRVVSHGGNLPDFSAFMAVLPDVKRGIVILTNADPVGLPPILAEVGIGAAVLLTGQSPQPIQLDFIPWAMRLLPLVPLLQVAGIAATLRKARRQEQAPEARLSQSRLCGLLPVLPSLGLAATPLLLHRRGMLRYLMRFNPDLAWVSIISGTLAGIGAVLRAGLILQAGKKPRR